MVRITAPNDHVVAATGVLQNPADVLTKTQIDRLKQAETAKEPIKIITAEEAKANESSKPTGKKTWIFKADNVRDFAFASSRKFIWDAQGHNVEGNKVMAMSLLSERRKSALGKIFDARDHSHPKCLFALFIYISVSGCNIVNGPVGGMEYPMICFNGPRPNADGSLFCRNEIRFDLGNYSRSRT